MRQQLLEQDVEENTRREYIQRQIFNSFEGLLDANKTGPTWLARKDVAEIVAGSIHYRDGKVFDLYAYCIMSNHIHFFQALET